MKLLIIATLIALAASARIGPANMHSHQFIQLMQTNSACGVDGLGFDVSQCGCQSQGCAYDNGNNQCVPNTNPQDNNVWAAQILGGCNEAHSEEACLGAKAWTNRFGGKTDCSWCSGICVSASNADISCTDASSGGWITLAEYRASYTINFEFWPPFPVDFPEPASPPVIIETPPPEVVDIVERSCSEGYCSTDSSFSATLSWDNCNDLDIYLYSPATAYTDDEGNPEMIYYGNMHPSGPYASGASLDVDYNAGVPAFDGQYSGGACPPEHNQPVEIIRWPNMDVPAAPGIYKIKIKFHASHQGPEIHTPYTLVVWDGYQHHIQQNDPTTFDVGSEDWYYFIVTEDRKLCFSYDEDSLLDPNFVCDPANN